MNKHMIFHNGRCDGIHLIKYTSDAKNTFPVTWHNVRKEIQSSTGYLATYKAIAKEMRRNGYKFKKIPASVI